jgi:L-amino acid N-acyltransferase YncA
MEVRVPVIDIFNHYIENSFAAYPDRKVPYDFFNVFLRMTAGYPAVAVKDSKGTVIGFGLLHAYHPIGTFSGTAEITYFLRPGYTGRGVGHSLLKYLLGKAAETGLSSVLASISSLNDGSINFHKKNGFVECGRFKGIGNKNGRVFDVVWMQKILPG